MKVELVNGVCRACRRGDCDDCASHFWRADCCACRHHEVGRQLSLFGQEELADKRPAGAPAVPEVDDVPDW